MSENTETENVKPKAGIRTAETAETKAETKKESVTLLGLNKKFETLSKKIDSQSKSESSKDLSERLERIEKLIFG